MDQTQAQEKTQVVVDQVEQSATTASSLGEQVDKTASPVKNADLQGQERQGDPQTPSPVKTEGMNLNVDRKAQSANVTQTKGKGRYNKRDQNGRPRNFYNPPSKVLRHLAQQSYYDNFYGNQGQFYTLKQKYKTQLCKHFMEHGTCSLEKYCQFAHGAQELRQANDPLPKNFGKTALGAVHSNYKTIPCKFWEAGQPCKFGESCSFHHGEDRRALIDPLPNLPEGVTLPPMPEKIRHPKSKWGHKKKQDQGQYGVTGFDGQQNNFMQLTNIADLAAIGGFNPNKYLSSQPPPPQPPAPFTSAKNNFQKMSLENAKQYVPKQQPAPPVVKTE